MIPAIMMGVMAGMQVVGAIGQYNQQKAAAKFAKKQGKLEQMLAERRAQVLEEQAGQESAASQRQMLAERQQGALVSGRTRALAAASGASLASPSVVQGLADIAGTEEERVGQARFEGGMRARSLKYGAGVERAGGVAAKWAGNVQSKLQTSAAQNQLISNLAGAGMTAMGATGMGGGGGAAPTTSSTIMQSGSPMYQKYGGGGFTAFNQGGWTQTR